MRELEHQDGRTLRQRALSLGYRSRTGGAKHSRRKARNRDEKPDAVRGVAAKIEHYNDVETLQAYAQQAATKELKHLMAPPRRDVERCTRRAGIERPTT